MYGTANVFQNQGKYDEALERYRRALAGEEKSLGEVHPNTLSTVSGMAAAFQSQGKYNEALEWYRRALTGKTKSLGNGHPDTLSTVFGMATVFHLSGTGEHFLEREVSWEESPGYTLPMI